MDNAARLAGVVELVDAPDSKSGARNGVRVRVPPPAPLSALKKFKKIRIIPKIIIDSGKELSPISKRLLVAAGNKIIKQHSSIRSGMGHSCGNL